MDTKLVRLIEPVEGGGCHMVFDELMGRVVIEEYEDLKPFFDVLPMSKAGLQRFGKMNK